MFNEPIAAGIQQEVTTICMGCHRVQDNQGGWQHINLKELESAPLELSHGLCPACARKLYPEYYSG